MPIVLTSLLMCFVFALPIDSGEKMSYALTVLLSYVVFLTWVTDNLPSVSNDVSVLREYLTFMARLLNCSLANVLKFPLFKQSASRILMSCPAHYSGTKRRH